MSIALAFALAGSLAVALPNLDAASLRPLVVRGNTVMTDRGVPIRLRGVNVACMEWSSDGEGHVLKTVEVAIKDWKVNHIRLPLSQDRWFGMAPEQKDSGVAYRNLVRQCVDLCAGNGVYIMLDLHWNNAGEWGENIGQHVMPDMYTLEFWKDCAEVYKNHPAVLFDLYNEPHDTTWEIWRNGGEISETRGVGARQGPFKPVTYQTPGMQALVDAVRETGAKNLIVAGGLDWSYDLSGVLGGKGLKDPKGNGILYACHAYPFKGDTVDQWIAKMKRYTKELAVVVSEFGANNPPARANEPNPWVVSVLGAMKAHRWNYTAWDLHPAAGPTLISNWDYTPTPSFGALVKADLEKP